ncbi:MAG: tyrosine-type recombinase/integrase [Nocardioides sp.]|uniref:tyrosine-type recombinase/integrase n=1 Tax=Nocardioides sp. TaxID=35761 RepID=UPI003D6A43A2
MKAKSWPRPDLVFTTGVGTELDAANVRRTFRRALKKVPSLNREDWTPRELRHSFVSALSEHGVPIDEISRLVGHKGGSAVTERVYRKQIRPVIQTGAQAMDEVFGTTVKDA